MDQSFNELTRMLLNTLDTFIGFAGVMLIMSLVVTALVQFIQNSFKLRAKNLQVGLQALLEKVLDEPTGASTQPASTAPTAPPSTGDKSDRPQKCKSAEVREKVSTLASFVPQKECECSSLVNRLFSPTTTWVSEAELVEHLKTAGIALSPEQGKRLTLFFQRMEDYLSKRFILNVRIITILCAVLVAGYFQLSTPALLKRLSVDERYRAQVAGEVERVYRDAPTLIAASTNYEHVSAMALERLAAKHPEHAATLERASGLGTSREEIVAELRTVLAPLPAATQSQLVAEYEGLLTTLQERAVGDASGQLGELTGRLAKFDITPWQYGWKFFSVPQNIVGVLITAIFLTFGAPFWYERLRELIQLRDVLKPKNRSDDSAPADKKQ